MTCQTVSDDSGRFQFDIEVNDPVLVDAIEHRNAEDVLKCAVLLALSVLAQSGPWPGAALENMSVFMTDMRTTLVEGLN